jgi:glycosyltransferase involved in cell wall biosynthesis
MSTDKARILYVTGEYPPHRGGISDYTAMLRAEVDALGYRTYVLSAEGAQGPGVFTIGSWSWPVALQLREIIEAHPVDIVHIQYQAGAFDMHPAINALPTTLSAWLRIPVVTTFHDLRVPYLFPKAGRLRNAVMLRMARASTAVIVTNPGDQRILDRAEIPTLRVPLGPSLPPPSAGGAGRANGTAASVGYFGFPSREKGLLDLIAALGRFPEGERPALTLVGAPRPDSGAHQYLTQHDLDGFSQEQGIEIVATGYLPPQAASDRLAACSALSLPFPNGATQRSSALIAALHLGRPVVTTSSDLDSDLDGLAGLPQLVTVRPGDIDALHAALRRALDSRTSSKELPPQYHWSTIGERHAAIYDELAHSALTARS